MTVCWVGCGFYAAAKAAGGAERGAGRAIKARLTRPSAAAPAGMACGGARRQQYTQGNTHEGRPRRRELAAAAAAAAGAACRLHGCSLLAWCRADGRSPCRSGAAPPPRSAHSILSSNEGRRRQAPHLQPISGSGPQGKSRTCTGHERAAAVSRMHGRKKWPRVRAPGEVTHLHRERAGSSSSGYQQNAC